MILACEEARVFGEKESCEGRKRGGEGKGGEKYNAFYIYSYRNPHIGQSMIWWQWSWENNLSRHVYIHFITSHFSKLSVSD